MELRRPSWGLPSLNFLQSPRFLAHLSLNVLTVTLVVTLLQFPFNGLNGSLLDFFVRLQWKTTRDPRIALIAYDDESSQRYRGTSRLPPEEIREVTQALEHAHIRSLTLLAEINERIYTDSELQMLGESFGRLPRPFIGYVDDASLGMNAPARLLPHVVYLPGYVSRDTYSFGADSVTRRVMLSIDGIPTVYSFLAGKQAQPDPLPPAGTVDLETGGRSRFAFISWDGPPGTYPIYSSYSVATGQIPPHEFDGKIVLFGTKLSTNKEKDYLFSPYSRQLLQMSTLEGAANSLSTLLQGDGLIRTTLEWNLLLSVVTALIVVNLAAWLTPLRGILLTAGLLTFWLIAGFFLYTFGRIWLDLAHPLMATSLSYYLVVPYRLVSEYRKRWHYQEKSELMQQLEQLKSNFLSLVSHDLKTPLARIQGNAELVLHGSPALPERTRRQVETIIRTTEGMSEYVESMLDLTRIESKSLSLNRVSKDINDVVAEVIEEKRFLAQEKNIQIVSDLEPLFSFRFDVKLIKRVLSNLLENAIKYSPGGTVVRLKTGEEANWIKIEIADQGVGISADDQSKLFKKFFRASNTSPDVKGSGLGLYLVKYFVELHEGLIDLKSTVGSGSTFTVRLPV